jgi:hypothetical protein
MTPWPTTSRADFTQYVMEVENVRGGRDILQIGGPVVPLVAVDVVDLVAGGAGADEG